MAATTPPSTSPAKPPSSSALGPHDGPSAPGGPDAAGAVGRIAALDVLRGIAIIGTLASNIWIFTAPGGPAEWISTGFAATDPVQRVLQALVNGKFLGLLTLLFGVGLELQYRSMVRRGLPWPGRYALRAGILFVEGLLHYILVFEFDVLMGYAIASLLAAYLIGRSDRVVRAWGGVLAAVYVAGIVSVTALLVLSGAADDADAAGGGTAASGGGQSATAPTDVLSTASWLDQVLLRITHMDVFRIELILIVPSATILFLVGSRLVRAGMFSTNEGGARLRRRLAWVGLGAGLPLNALTAWAGPDWFLVDRYLVPPLVAVGILALGTSLVDRARARAGTQAPRAGRSPGALLRRGVEAVGRTALSCYVLQNVLASALCYDWGLGLAGGGPWQAVAIWAGVSLALMLLAPLWLRRWPRGPIELLMHRVYDARRR
ncbi:DUF418 domain-containing protein [Promicromonospora vindobonensis]|uniref:DUF418 domain-containing protein n=1 Tax=Promicromonospora vindobonensis TaxID=195748 RepID=A0ABW5VPL8_9MICO